MTLSELQSRVYDQLPSVPRMVGGRLLVNRIVRRAVVNWPVPVLEQCDEAEANVVGHHMAKSVERSIRQEVGMGIILTLVLGALVQEVVKILIRWWLESRENKDAMRLLTREARHHD